MKGAIVNFRGGRHTQYTSQIIIQPENTKNREEANKLKGKTVIWTTPSKKQIKGNIKKAHGNSGAVLAKFEKGLPGQSISTKVDIE